MYSSLKMAARRNMLEEKYNKINNLIEIWVFGSSYIYQILTYFESSP
jgi:hypothetical protein